MTLISETFPTSNFTDLRNIGGLLNCDKLMESLLAELIMGIIE